MAEPRWALLAHRCWTSSLRWSSWYSISGSRAETRPASFDDGMEAFLLDPASDRLVGAGPDAAVGEFFGGELRGVGVAQQLRRKDSLGAEEGGDGGGQQRG
eukprot:5272441-Pleurochrysis_carterae.AAC.2